MSIKAVEIPIACCASNCLLPRDGHESLIVSFLSGIYLSALESASIPLPLAIESITIDWQTRAQVLFLPCRSLL